MMASGGSSLSVTKVAIHLRILIAFGIVTLFMTPFTALNGLMHVYEDDDESSVVRSGLATLKHELQFQHHLLLQKEEQQQKDKQQKQDKEKKKEQKKFKKRKKLRAANVTDTTDDEYEQPIPIRRQRRRKQDKGGNELRQQSSSTSPFDRIDDLPVPVQVMEQYKQWHSIDAIRRNPYNRTWAIGFYTCPFSAGNRIHEFMNDLLWSIVTNRTLLWKYFDEPTCNKWKLKPMKHQLKCHQLNTVQDCDRMLTRAPWLPSYDELSQTIPALRSSKNAKPYFAPEPQFILNLSDKKKAYRRVMHNTAGVKGPRLLVAFPRIVGQVDFLHVQRSGMMGLFGGLVAGLTGDSEDEDDDENEDKEEKEEEEELPKKPKYSGSEKRVYPLEEDSWAEQQAEKLYSLGKPFLYGMLHRNLFDFSSAVKHSVPELWTTSNHSIAATTDNHETQSQQQQDIAAAAKASSNDKRRIKPPLTDTDNNTTFTIALHSRHPNGLDGCNIKPEIECIRKIVDGYKTDQYKSCKMWILADRKCTISTLTEWLQKGGDDSENGSKYKCDVEVATHEQGHGTKDEHGDFAGIGFFQDLVLASTQARHAIIGSPDRSYRMRTSSNLLTELIEYRKRMEAWRDGHHNISQIEDAPQCLLSIPLEFLEQ